MYLVAVAQKKLHWIQLPSNLGKEENHFDQNIENSVQ